MALPIGRIAEKSGCSPPTIRYYESIGLLPPPSRAASGRRTYGSEDIARLTFIRRAREFGLGIPEVREVLAAAEAPAGGCIAARPVIAAHVEAIRAKRAELTALDEALSAILSRCDEACQMGKAGPCAIFETLQLPGTDGS